jgi:ketosteroid isomerase-like protein
MTTTRSGEEIFAHHAQALGAEDLDGIISDYADDAVLIVQGRVLRGLDGVRAAFTQLLQEVPQAAWQVDTVFVDDVLYLEWKARSANSHIEDGIDTFVFRDGRIQVQTVRYTVQR